MQNVCLKENGIKFSNFHLQITNGYEIKKITNHFITTNINDNYEEQCQWYLTCCNNVHTHILNVQDVGSVKITQGYFIPCPRIRPLWIEVVNKIKKTYCPLDLKTKRLL